MKKIALLSLLLGLFSLYIPTEAYAGYHKKSKTTKIVKVKVKKKTYKKVKANKVKKLKPRHAKNINNPQEGELLKLEGMIKSAE